MYFSGNLIRTGITTIIHYVNSKIDIIAVCKWLYMFVIPLLIWSSSLFNIKRMAIESEFMILPTSSWPSCSLEQCNKCFLLLLSFKNCVENCDQFAGERTIKFSVKRELQQLKSNLRKQQCLSDPEWREISTAWIIYGAVLISLGIPLYPLPTSL